MRFVLYGVIFVVVLYAFIDVVMSPGAQVRALPKPIWALLVLLVPVLGAVAWFVWGRPRAAIDGGPARGRRRGPAAPDDDPAFLRRLEDEAWAETMRKRRALRDGQQPSPPPPGQGEAGADGPAVDSGSS